MGNTKKPSFVWIVHGFLCVLMSIPISHGESFAAVEVDACTHPALIPGSACTLPCPCTQESACAAWVSDTRRMLEIAP